MARPSLKESDFKLGLAELFQRTRALVPAQQHVYSDGHGALSYQQLDHDSDALAAALLHHLGPGTKESQKPVLLLVEHGADVFTGVLGVVKSGHFYVPMEAYQGVESLAFIVADCPGSVLVVSQALEPLARRVAPGVEILVLGQNPESAPLPAVAASGDMFYAAVFTSGSTGRPRGVPRSHTQQILGVYRAFCHGAYDGGKVAFVTSYSQLFSGIALFGTLLTGATAFGNLVGKLSPRQIGDWLRNYRITFLPCPPGVLKAVGHEGEALPDLRTVLTSMESLPRAAVEALSAKLTKGSKLVFLYASTEAGTMATFVVEVGTPWVGDFTPAGVPDRFHRVTLIDDEGRPVSPGATGQIRVAGPYMNHGYWHRPDDTAAHFFPDPDEVGSMVYLTGDLGRFNDQGLLEHRGRVDFMLKIRGYRVEPQEIERTLLRHESVAECVVTAFSGSQGNSRLVAYCTVKPGFQGLPNVLREHLQATLAPHLIPSRFVFLDELPSTAVGKVDRLALPPPGLARPALSTPFVAPQADHEKLVAEVWGAILRVDDVGVDDNFFELGGDSLSAMEMLGQVENELGTAVPQSYLDHPTIRNLLSSAGTDGSTSAQYSRYRSRIRFSRTYRILRRFYQLARALGLGWPFYQSFLFLAALGAWLPWSGLAERREHVRLFRSFAEAVGSSEDPGAVGRRALQLKSLRNLWGTRWRGPVPPHSRLVSLVGREHLVAALKHQRGVVLVTWHSQAFGLIEALLDTFEVPRYGMKALRADKSGRTEAATYNGKALQTAAEVLRRGGVVYIYPDATRGARPLSHTFLSGRRDFYPGFAALAMHENALVLPVSVRLQASGRFVAIVEPPFESGESRLQDQYVRFLERQWKTATPDVRTKSAEAFLTDKNRG